MKPWLVALLISAAFADTAHAQILDLELGGGYVFAGGAENPGPSLATFDAGATVWPWSRWGVAVRLVKGPGEDLLDAPLPSGDRTFLGQADLHYWTVTARYRRPVGSTRRLELGFGQLFGGRFSTVQEFPNPPRRIMSPDTSFPLGFALEGFLTQEAGRWFAVKAGATFDFNFETTNFQPLLLGVVRF